METNLSRAADACPETRYTKLPDALVDMLTAREHQLVHALLSYRWFEDSEIFPSVPLLARRLRWSVRTVQRTLRRLEDGGWIVTIARYRDDSGQTSNLYRPGPRLLAELSPAPVRESPAPVTDRRPSPVSDRTGERDERGNRTHGSRTNRSGYIRPRTAADLLVSRQHGRGNIHR